ncbi:MAG: protein kinase [Thermoguttaceae bacterium]
MLGNTVQGNPEDLLQHKLAGYTVHRFLAARDNSSWYEGRADNGEHVLLYVYESKEARDAARVAIHGFRTTADLIAHIGAADHSVFLIIGEYRVMMPGTVQAALTSPATGPSLVGDYEVQGVLGNGYKGVTYAVRRRQGPGTGYALKLTVAEEYEGRTYLPEVGRMVELARRDRDHFPQIHACGRFTHVCGADQQDLIYFVEDYINGATLETFLSRSPEKVDAHFLYLYLTEMLQALAVLEACDLMHDDLHAGNVILHQPAVGRPRPYLIDFGSAKQRGTTKKERDDLRNLATHIAAIANIVQQNSSTRTAQEDRILASCEALLAIIGDDDPMRRPDSATEVLQHFESSLHQGAISQELRHPFDFGNAEEVLDNNLLYALSAKSFPWRDQIEASSHLLVIGPRGCGKTTVFRSMSFRCMADAGKAEEALERPFIGLYVSCNREFRLRFSALDAGMLLRRETDLRHYFNMIVLREFTTCLIACQASHRLAESDVAAYRGFVTHHASLLQPGNSEKASLGEIEAQITRVIHEVRMGIWRDQQCNCTTAQGFIADLAEFMAARIDCFLGKVLYLFVDDYTERKVPKQAQQALNHVLFVPNASYKCKISSEVFGVTPDQTFGEFLAQDRDYREWNLGTLYCLKLPSQQQKAFLGEIVNNRLAICRYQGTVQSLIGQSRYAEGTLARTLKREAELRQEKRQERRDGRPPQVVVKEVEQELAAARVPAQYHGWDTVCELCTGDVSNILELLNRMFEQCGVTRDTTSVISADSQDAVIEGYSRQYIAKIKGIPRYGERLFAIVDAFGNLSKRLLNEYPWISRPDNRRDPYQLLRIELDEAEFGGAPPDSTPSTDNATASRAQMDPMQLWRLLQRYCLFIDADESRSRRNTLSSRVILRRVFCPAFRIGLVNSECFTLSRDQWSAFCHDPSGRAEQFVRDVVETANRKRGPEYYPLFPPEQQP